MTLAAKSIVITGAGRGIGRACAILAAEMGASVVVNDIDADAAAQVCADIGANGGKALADGSDISSWSGSEAMVERCVSAFGGIDGLINNAGLFRPCRLIEADEQIFRAVKQVIIAGLHGWPQLLVVESARSGLSHDFGPELSDSSTRCAGVNSWLQRTPRAAKTSCSARFIVKKITMVAAGRHGGAWKVAYADFVIAMMAFVCCCGCWARLPRNNAKASRIILPPLWSRCGSKAPARTDCWAGRRSPMSTTIPTAPVRPGTNR